MAAKDFVPSLVELAQGAGAEILRLQKAGYAVSEKEDGSPVTEADLASHDILFQGLQSFESGIPVISEEGNMVPVSSDFWLVDPLDGTREFIEGHPTFSINIALIQKGIPILGLLFFPAQNLLFVGGEEEGVRRNGELLNRPTSWEQKIIANMPKASELVSSALPVTLMKGAYKFCTLFEGQALLYPRKSPSYEWDTAAGHALLRAFGGGIWTLDKQELSYGKDSFLNPAFIAYAHHLADI